MLLTFDHGDDPPRVSGDTDGRRAAGPNAGEFPQTVEGPVMSSEEFRHRARKGRSEQGGTGDGEIRWSREPGSGKRRTTARTPRGTPPMTPPGPVRRGALTTP